ncbi:MAG: YwiC-like family protein [Actinomycetota bacterium]|nr:YwiC-like family protein [Actinomycetota bacterium]
MAVPGSARRVSLVPPAHGAWAFIGLPVAVAIALTGMSWLVAVLGVAWVLAYPASYFALAMVKDTAPHHRRPGRQPRPGRYVRPLVTWGLPAAALGAVALAAQPWLAWVGLGYAALFAVNAAFARRRDERSLVNDAVLIVECALVVPVTWAADHGSGGWVPPAPSTIPAQAWILCAAVALLLTGSTLHVKSLIRERANPAFATASRTVAFGSIVAAAALAWAWGLPEGLLLLLPFGYLAGRAITVPGRSMAPGRIGMIELAGYLLLVAVAFLLAPP